MCVDVIGHLMGEVLSSVPRSSTSLWLARLPVRSFVVLYQGLLSPLLLTSDTLDAAKDFVACLMALFTPLR